LSSSGGETNCPLEKPPDLPSFPVEDFGFARRSARFRTRLSSSPPLRFAFGSYAFSRDPHITFSSFFEEEESHGVLGQLDGDLAALPRRSFELAKALGRNEFEAFRYDGAFKRLR
jgi:hypothetical protein